MRDADVEILVVNIERTLQDACNLRRIYFKHSLYHNKKNQQKSTKTVEKCQNLKADTMFLISKQITSY